MADDNDDEVLYEVDVFLTKTAKDDLLLLQYPTKPPIKSWFDDVRVTDAKVKPEQKLAELTVAVDIEKTSFDFDRASQFAVTAGSNENYEEYFGDRQVYHTTQSTPCKQNYFAGIMKDGQLHLPMISGIVQMNPSFLHLNTETDKKADIAPAVENEEQEAKTVTVRFAKAEGEYAKRAQERSYGYHLRIWPLISTLKNIGAVCVSLKWPKTMTDVAIYEAVDFNDGTEKLRRSFLAQFRDTNQQKKHIIKKNMQKDSETISDDDLASLLKDYCSLSKKGFFIIKFSKI